MSVHLTDNLFQLPGVRQFLHALLDDLAQGRSVLALAPAGIDLDSIWQAIREDLWRRDFHVQEIPLPSLSVDDPPAAALGHALQVQWASPNAPRTVANLLSAGRLPDIVQLHGFEQLPSTTIPNWTNFLAQWGQASQNVADQGQTPTALCLLTPASALLPHLPESNVYLTIHWWWGIPSALELRLLCRLEESDLEWDIAARWREHLLPSLAGNDVALAEHLWDDLSLDTTGLSERLRTFALARGWTTDNLQGWGASQLIAANGRNNHLRSLLPPNHLRALWSQGALSWTPEYGLELHSAALALLGLKEVLNHRLWRGQAALMLPLIDSVRLNLCSRFTRFYGCDWPVRWFQPESSEEDNAVRDNPLACQWGYLALLLRKCNALRSERRWLPLVSQLHQIRNELAHYRPISFSDIERVWPSLQAEL